MPKEPAIPSTIAEYLGRRVDAGEVIIPTHRNSAKIPICPFMGQECSKLKSDDPKHPICSLRTKDGIYIVCSDRLIPARAKTVTPEHKHILSKVSELVFPGSTTAEVLYRRQAGLKIGPRSNVYLDYVLVHQKSGRQHRPVILEVQGGGETSNTGTMTRLVTSWANNQARTNKELAQPLYEVKTKTGHKPKKVYVNGIPNNAWKRQLDQVLLKATIAESFGGAFALACGSVLFDYLLRRGLTGTDWFDQWAVVIVELKEVPSTAPGAVPFTTGRAIFMSYSDFVESIQSYSLPDNLTSPFYGKYTTLEDRIVVIDDDQDGSTKRNSVDSATEAVVGAAEGS